MEKEHLNNLSFILWVLATLFWMWGFTQVETNIGYHAIGFVCLVMTFVQSLDIKMDFSIKDNPYE